MELSYRIFENQGREAFECLVCGAKGAAGKGQTAQELADAHFEKARLHFKAVAARPITKEERRNGLAGYLASEFKVFSISESVATIAADLATTWFISELRERDELIARLQRDS